MQRRWRGCADRVEIRCASYRRRSARHADAQIEYAGRAADERLTGFPAQLVSNGGGQAPRQDRQVAACGGCRAGGCLVVGVSGDAGVVEHQQPVWTEAGDLQLHVAGELGRWHVGKAAIWVGQQGHRPHTQLAAGLTQFLFRTANRSLLAPSVEDSPCVRQSTCSERGGALPRLPLRRRVRPLM